MKRKKKNWDTVPWTPFTAAVFAEADKAVFNNVNVEPDQAFRNSRYQVSVWYHQHPTFGVMAHLSIKTHDRQARHDWRDLQRIKNELCGPECDAVEVYPSESKLVDSANQYHLFVFRDHKLDFGFQTRLVSEDRWINSRQRPFPKDAKPTDLVGNDVMDAIARGGKGGA